MRDVPDPGFAGDDGSAEPGLVQALRDYDVDPHALHDATLAVLQGTRLLVPVVAALGEVVVEETADGRSLAHDKTSDMATVLLQGQDGRSALLAFTSTESLRRWNSEARPVPVPVQRAARAALQDGAAAIVVDVAGPVMFVVDGEAVRQLAEGRLLVRLGAAVSDRFGWVTPDP
ncbi:MAG TPA: SseB family protein [Nocardioidaceae bacterium]|nr:SseB family protein [Nocardioidaceae bacterium]